MERCRIAILPSGLLLLVFLSVDGCVPRPIGDLRVLGVSRLAASELPKTSDLRDTLMARGDKGWKISLLGG